MFSPQYITLKYVYLAKKQIFSITIAKVYSIAKKIKFAYSLCCAFPEQRRQKEDSYGRGYVSLWCRHVGEYPASLGRLDQRDP